MKKTIIIVLIFILGIQFIPSTQANPSADPAIALNPPEEVQKLLKRACYDCHSNNTQWPIYSKIAPASFAISFHVSDGREAINFSEYETIDSDTKRKRLKRASHMIKIGFMPPSSYSLMHSEADLTLDEKKVLIKYFEELHDNESSQQMQ